MVDPHTAAAGTGTLMTVAVFIGSQLSPSIMIRRAVKKELKAAVLLEQNGSNIDPVGWAELSMLERNVRRSELSLEDTTWGEVLKQPFKLLVRAHKYHDASDAYLHKSRSVSAQALVNAARGAAGQSSSTPTAADDSRITEFQATAPCGPYAGSDSAAGIDGLYTSYDSVMEVDNPYVTRFDNVTITAGTRARIILHFGVGDVPAIFNPCTHLPRVPAWYSGPLVLSGIAKLFPSNLDNDRDHAPDVVIGRRMYDLEFHGLRWSVPPNHRVSVSGRVEDDGVSVASLEAAYGGNRSTMMMLDNEIDLLTPYYRPIGPR